LSWEITCTESQNNFEVYLPLQAAQVNFCDQRDCALSVSRVVAGAVKKNLSELENLSACLKTDSCFLSVLEIAKIS